MNYRVGLLYFQVIVVISIFAFHGQARPYPGPIPVSHGLQVQDSILGGGVAQFNLRHKLSLISHFSREGAFHITGGVYFGDFILSPMGRQEDICTHIHMHP